MNNKIKKVTGYDREFRETAIKLALAGNKSIAAVAKELDMSSKMLYSWVSAWKKKNGDSNAPRSKNSAEDELRKLQKRLKEVELENEILKKAAAYFAKTLL